MEFNFLTRHRNTSFKFLGDYEQKMYEIMQKQMHPEFWKYSSRYSISYDFNSDGFRAPEFSEIDWKNTSVVLGCSYVFGQGVENDNSISEILTREYGVPFVNGGVAGASNRIINDNALVFMKKYNPKKIIIIWTHENRSTWLTEWDEGRNSFRHETILPQIALDNTKRKDMKKKKIPEDYFLPECADTIHSNMSYKATQDLLGNKHYSLDSNNRGGKLHWLKPKDNTLYEWKDKIESGEIKITRDTLAKPEIYEFINHMGARDIQYDEKNKKLWLGHLGEAVNRDIADVIYRENFK